MNSQSILARARAWLFLLVLAIFTLGGNAPPESSSSLPPRGFEPARPEQLGAVCPAYDPSKLPDDLPAVPTVSAGSILGSFAVSSSGAATYTIPLVVPPGRMSMEPSLSIAYDSAGGEGFLGRGFALGGLSAISRCPASLAQDGYVRAVKMDANDVYCLDGLRLVLVGQEEHPDGTRTSEFRTFPDTFAKVLAHYAATPKPDRGPERWEVFAKSGHIVDYGANPNSRAMAKDQRIAAWWIRRERDKRGNAVLYTYDNTKDADGHTTEIVPLQIGYALQTDSTPSRIVSFVTVPSAAPTTYYHAGMRLRRTKVLLRVDMITEPYHAWVRSYRLHYAPSEGTGRDLLRSVEECAGAGPCKPATRFGWSAHVDYGTSVHITPLLMPGDDFDQSSRRQWLLADVDGDGLEDIVISRPRDNEVHINEWWVAHNHGGGFDSATRWASFGYPAYAGRWELTAMDYDQDGLTDILLDSNTGYWPTFRWLRATPAGTFELRDTGLFHPIPIPEDPEELYGYRFVRLGDVNGDGVADLIQCVNYDYADNDDPSQRRWTVHLWSPSLPGGPGFEPGPRAIPYIDGVVDCGQGKRNIHVADTDGDGRAELIVPFVGGTYGAIRHLAGDAWDSADLALPRWVDRRFTRLHWLNANGDGLPDVVMTNVAHGGCYGANGSYDGTACGEPPEDKGEWSADLPFRFTNTGDGFGDIEPTLPGQLYPDRWTDYFGDAATPIDWNGDGRLDLMLPSRDSCGYDSDEPCWVVLQASPTGEGHMTPIQTGIPSKTNYTGRVILDYFALRVTDVDGDGRQDIIVPEPASPGRFRVYTSGGPQDLLLSITDGASPLDPGEPGFVPTVSIAYGSLVDTTITKGIGPGSPLHQEQTYIARSNPNNGCSYPRSCVTGSERVVESYYVNNGTNHVRSFHLRYRDGRYHKTGRGFLGFEERIVIDGDTGAGVIERYDNVTHLAALDVFPYAGQVVRSAAWSNERASAADPGRVEIVFTQRTMVHQSTNGGASYFTLPWITRTTRQSGVMTLSPGKTVLGFVRQAEAAPLTVLGDAEDRVTAVDPYGNVLAETHKVTGVDLSTTVDRQVDNDPSSWLLGLVRSEDTCSTALSVTQCRSLTRDYNALGEVESEDTGDLDDPGTQLSTAFVRDDFGHVVQVSATDAFGHHRAACVTYDADGLFPHATRNAVGHVTYAKLDAARGVLVASVDENGLVTRWAHDGFGRATEELRPDGTRTTVKLIRHKLGGPQGNWWRTDVVTTEDGGASTRTELDSLGRALRTVTEAASVEACGASLCKPSLSLEQRTEYDFLGRVTKVDVPWMEGDSLSAKLHHTYAYDASGRLVKHVEPWGRVTTFTHDGLVTTSIDWLGTTLAETDALGRVVRAVDRKGYATETHYGPFGAPWVTTRFGTETNVTEGDAYGRVVVEEDPDRGTTETSYDGFGDVLTVDDALGRHYAFRHDALGRTIEREDIDGVTRWAYDTALHGKGRVARVESPDGVKRYTYDALSRTASVALALGGETFQASFGYDDKSRLRRIDYPVVPGVAPMAVLRDYDARGNLIRVRDSAQIKPYWQLDALDGAGRTAAESFGNGVTTTRAFAASTGLVLQIQTSLGGTAIQDLAYAYDKDLRMTARTDRRQVGPGGARTEVFTHDALGRLTCSKVTDVPLGQDSPASAPGPCALGMGYQPNGNIAYKSGVGTYVYEPARPHVLSRVGLSTYEHDAVGNQTKRPGASIHYTAFDLPRGVTMSDGDTVVGFAYDGDQQRIRKRSPDEETVYFEDLYERVTDGAGRATHRFYVAAGSATVVLTRKPGTIALVKDMIAYLHTDTLGSTDVITDGAGGVVERRSHDAFGAPRNPGWGAAIGPVAYTSKVAPIGFTGHESDEDLGLINMRGRVYDPKLGRFLTTDPIVSMPHFGQSWHPYSYVLNSPLNFVDPSGFQAAHAPRPAGCDECRWSAPDNKWYRTETRREEAAVGGGLTALRFEIEVKDGARDDKASRAPVAEDRATKAKRVLTGALGHLGRVATGVVLKALPITAPIVVGREVKALAKSVWQDPKAHASDAALAAVAPGAWVTVHTHGMAMAGKAAADRGDLEGVGEQVAAAGVFVGSLVVVPLLGPEAAEAGAAEAGAATPRLPTYAGGKTVGVLRSALGDIPLISGYKGPSAAMPRGTPGMNGNIKSHVEAHAASIMRQQNVTEGVLYINQVPCSGVRGCGAMLVRMLPEGARLRVLGPDGYNELFIGRPD